MIEVANRHLHPDAFALSFTSNECLSANPTYALEFQAASAGVNLGELLGEVFAIRIALPGGGWRHFSTYATGGSDQGQRGNQYVYRIELGSWLWFLMQNHNCRIFQNLSVPAIVEQVFSRYRVARYRLELQDDYPQREYCVQFRETDFDFFNRLLEDEGIHYYVEQGDGEHTLVISDRRVFMPLPLPYDRLDFRPDGEEQRAIREGVQRIQRSRRVLPGEIVLCDYDYLSPGKSLNAQAGATTSADPLEWYDYGAGYQDAERGGKLARLRLEALQADASLIHGESNAVGLLPGRRFELTLHPEQARNRGFALLQVQYTFLQDGPDSQGDGKNVSCRFIALDDDIVFRPRRLTRKPSVPGIQSATVVGPPGVEVHTDELSRIRVHFHWDRYKTTEEDASCWIRVVQAWAGKGWGALFMPRVGQEVLVNYVDGDLDRPLVTGVVYNGENPPPYDLPTRVNYSGFVSRSLKQGTPNHATQLTFDDTRGAERLMLHAERDMQQSVERNKATTIGQDLYEQVERTATWTSENNFTYTESSYSVTGTSVSFVNNAASFVNINLGVTGVSTSLTGVSTSFTGVSTSFTGVSTSTTGISTSFTGVSTSFTGVSTGVVGVSTGLTGLSVSATGVSISQTGTSTSTTGTSTSTTGTSTSTTGTSTSTTGTSDSTTGTSRSVTGFSDSTVGVSRSTVGVTIDTSGTKTSSAGSESKTRGMQSKN
jgi:type VI secretion system secreted protein VgrG